MGNRCVILNKDKTKGIYQHWDGGRDSIEPLLQIAKEEYEQDRGEFSYEPFNAVLEVSKKVFNGDVLDLKLLSKFKSFSVGDNGIYIVDNKFKIVGREDFNGEEQNRHNPKRMELYIFLSYHFGDSKIKKIMNKVDSYVDSVKENKGDENENNV